MIDQNTILHCDCTAQFFDLLQGQKLVSPLTETTMDKIEDPASVKVITVKATSQLTPAVLQHFPHLQLIVSRTVGIDHIDETACQQRGIVVKNIPDYGGFAIAEHAFALLLSMTRRVVTLHDQTKQGVWSLDQAQGWTLEGKTLGMIGAGRIGAEIIRLAKAFRMNVLAYDPYERPELAKELEFKYVPLKKALAEAEVVILSVPLLDSTKHLINQKTIELMKQDVTLINVARGPVVDTEALVKNIDKFKFVGLDVLEDEDQFNADHPLLMFDHVVITPHCAFFTDRTTQIIVNKTHEIIEEFYRERK